MRIDFIEIKNFRRLAAVRLDFSERTTLFVGANNSGKTSAITSLRYFLIQQKAFSVYDIPLALWPCIDKLGEDFEKTENEDSQNKWKKILPSLDVWLKVSESEIHHVSHLIPTLDWTPDNGIGVRLQLEPKKLDELQKAYINAKKASCDTLNAAQQDKTSENPVDDQEEMGQKSAEQDGTAQEETEQIGGDATCNSFSLWPENLMDFLKKRMSSLTVKAYLLDPSKKKAPSGGVAQLQELPDDVEPLEDNPFKGLIKIDEVPAHRGLSDYSGKSGDGDESDQDDRGGRQLLTSQLRTYYGKHLDPLKAPEPSDITALQAIHEAQVAFDLRLKDCFKTSLDELEQLGYPGVANPRLIISTSIKPVEGLKHQSAVQYDVTPTQDKDLSPYRLPEQCNGLGYQNLISMVFRLISFRDDWMKVGKASRTDEETGVSTISLPPLHLILLEEPEAHLHVQVQQVFIRKAYDVLRQHPDLKDKKSPLSTQLVVSTHSSHVAHEVDFAHMRYFRRHPARNSSETPSSTVINLSEIFGTQNETAQWVSRYLQATHADLFFADGAILVEGAAERMLVPHFIRHNYKELHSCYVTLMEVGGSHAHWLAPLIEHLGLNTLIITDIDAVEDTSRKKTRPKRGTGLLTGNNVLKKLHPKKKSLDELLDLTEDKKERVYDDSFSIRVAYQKPVQVTLKRKKESSEAIARTFEDALVFENINLFREANGTGLLKKFKEAVTNKDEISELSQALFDALASGNKAGFALDMLYFQDPASINVPEYIHNGLKWLENKLLLRQKEILLKENKSTEAISEGT
ncbi:MAG: AAA family ATPase [Desulfobacterium sp.]|nr:AAA family ATPase [Desulfobacterium sp.]